MYNEKSFKITIIFTRIRRYLFIFFFVILGLIGAYVLSEFLTEIAKVERSITNMIMVITGISVFAIGFILTSNLEFKIQQAYLEMKTLKKLSRRNSCIQSIQLKKSTQPYMKINRRRIYVKYCD